MKKLLFLIFLAGCNFTPKEQCEFNNGRRVFMGMEQEVCATDVLDYVREQMRRAVLDCRASNRILKDFNYDFQSGSYDYICRKKK